MATSFQVAFLDPNNRPPRVTRRAACFGSMNGLNRDITTAADIMEWHPEFQGADKQKALIESFPFWRNTFRMTSVGTIVASLKEHPIDQIITGFMTMRSINCGGGPIASLPSQLPVVEGVDWGRVKYALYAAGITYSEWDNHPFALRSSPEGESVTTALRADDDAYALFLLIFGNDEECQNLFVQPVIGENLTQHGYIRDGSSNMNNLRQELGLTQNQYAYMAHWLRGSLFRNPREGKMGRLTVRSFADRLRARCVDMNNANDQMAVLAAMLEELKELYE